MYSVKAALDVCGIQLRKNLISGHTFLIALLMGMYLYVLLQPVRDMAAEVGYSVTPLAFVFLSCDSIAQMILMAGVVALFANAPFDDETYSYMIVRSGKGAWTAGNCMYILTMSFIYTAYIWLISTLVMFPYIDWQIKWGKIWGTLAATDAPERYGLQFSVQNGLKRSYEPSVALAHSLLAEWSCAAFLGECAYLFNKLTNKPIGTWLGAGFVFWDITIYNLFDMDWIKYSPLSLAMISNMINSRFGITLGYSLSFMAFGVAIMGALSYAHEKVMK